MRYGKMRRIRRFFSTYRSNSKLVGEAADGKLKDEVLFGVAPCMAALQAGRRKIFEVYLGEGAMNTTRCEFAAITESAKKKNVPVKIVPKSKLKKVSGDRPHQNVAMRVGPLKFLQLNEDEDRCAWKQSKYGRPALWVVLDEIQDPMNFGAILRTSAFLGVDRLLVPTRNRAPLSPVVSKASSGAMEMMDVYAVQNLAQCLKDRLIDDWDVLGTVQPKKDTIILNGRNIVSCKDYKIVKPTVLVLDVQVLQRSAPWCTLDGEVKAYTGYQNLEAEVASVWIAERLSHRRRESGGRFDETEIVKFDPKNNTSEGNEGTGINPTILAQCSGYVTIPPPFGVFALPVGLDSLNVSVATGILIFSLLGQHMADSQLGQKKTEGRTHSRQ